jgi:hypothetical protein
MLLVYAPDQPTVSITSSLGYQERWPGDSYVDIAAFDHYDHPPTRHHCAASNFTAEFLQDVHMVVNFAEAHGKVPAIAEFGVKHGSGGAAPATLDADWWTKCFLDAMAADPVASKIPYAMTWSNGNSVPIKGDFTFQNFLKFAKSSHTLLLRGWNAMKTDGV